MRQDQVYGTDRGGAVLRRGDGDEVGGREVESV